jgi:ribosome-binding protein aMBF1 (putative translation factor)
MAFSRKLKKHPERKLKKHLKLRKNMKTKKRNIMTLEQFKDKHYGVRGTSKRDQLEAGYQNFKIGALIQEARLEKGLTQEQLAEKVGTTKSYISKIENNIKEARISTLQKIVEVGFGGQLQLSIKL